MGHAPSGQILICHGFEIEPNDWRDVTLSVATPPPTARTVIKLACRLIMNSDQSKEARRVCSSKLLKSMQKAALISQTQWRVLRKFSACRTRVLWSGPINLAAHRDHPAWSWQGVVKIYTESRGNVTILVAPDKLLVVSRLLVPSCVWFVICRWSRPPKTAPVASRSFLAGNSCV